MKKVVAAERFGLVHGLAPDPVLDTQPNHPLPVGLLSVLSELLAQQSLAFETVQDITVGVS